MVVKSLRDRIRNRFEVSAAEVGFQDLHQRSRIAVAVVSAEEKAIGPVLENIVSMIESEASLVGWNHEILHFDESQGINMPHLKYE